MATMLIFNDRRTVFTLFLPGNRGGEGVCVAQRKRPPSPGFSEAFFESYVFTTYLSSILELQTTRFTLTVSSE